MREILGNNLEQFFSHIDKYGVESNLTYKGERYEVWEVDDDLFPKMCDMPEEEFVSLAGEDAWWRSSSGSNLSAPYEKNTVNGHILISWNKGCFDNETSYKTKKYESLSSYLCDCIGASQPKNVCALAMDLAKYNSMTMGELFTKYEGY